MTTPNPPTTLVSWLDDLTVRFLLNLPASELSSVPRLCFQVEEAQWYYEDFVRPFVAASGLPPLPSLPLRQFCLLLFQHCPLLSGFTDAQHIAAYEEFLAYKVRVPVRGAILLDEEMENVVLVRGWKKGASWSFPRGKINKDERDLDCAIREVYEETGYDVRGAGLVPEKEEEVKYIDITMREQHMRLFVFRGVSEDTYFEPRTRKEISKISWYSIKDLPGFKKQKGHGDGEGGNANKFYMVAPFLAPLKKWIGSQKKKRDRTVTARPVSLGNGRAAQTAMEEEEGEVEEEQTPEREVELDPRSEDLKRLLSIGEPAPATSTFQQPAPPDSNAGDLLAMLRSSAKSTNGTQKPLTPFEQINAFPSQPETPQPDHLRHPSLSQQQRQPPPPQFPLSPERSQQQQEQQRHGLTPTPQIFGPGSGFQQRQPHGFQGMPPPPHMQQQYLHQRQSMPGPMGGMPYLQRNGAPFNGQMRQPVHPSQMPPQSHMPPPHMQQQYQPQPSNVHYTQIPQGSTGPQAPQGPQGAIGSGPAVPNASQLPPPRLNAQSMKLLDAFKSGAIKPTTSIAPTPGQTQRPPSTHQTALLDLFRKPSTSQSPAIAPVDEPASPALTDVTVKPSRSTKRRSTLNEITRTLPMKPKVTSPPILEPEAHSRKLPSVSGSESERTRSRELFKPKDHAESQIISKSPPPAVGQEAQSRPAPGIAQPAPPQQASRSPRPKYAMASGSPSRRDVAKASQEGRQGAPPVRILARPGSARDAKSPAPPLSPARNEAAQKTGFQPQLLKRPKASADAVSDTEQQKPADKKDQLLALFGKSPAPSPSAQAPPPAPSEQSNERKDALLGLFGNTSSQQPTPSPAPALAATPPPAPRIEPERRTSSRTAAPPMTSKPQQQNLLLDLFHTKGTKYTSSSAQGTPLTSPGTPISPFTLGTPARSRLGSVASITSDGSSTPTEAKEFLMGYLNGVVRNEGLRGAGARGR
ncbi:mRNA-decapping enzyme subunit 2 [Vermiconidia calcicola]|uniref:mRNA-decapping enzyme subunit 2 n=1 Tax=Vermiconidia calcicola TaxID=1690605 RepID=A0ACC3MPW0_9PEZI|nr:mRNA-decapping enzyme subunit 2 [Vermiconidia calcicola]